jgi:hypothetical protein
MKTRRFAVRTLRGTLDSTNDLRHALKLVAKQRGYPTLEDNQPDPKHRWLKKDINAAKE